MKALGIKLHQTATIATSGYADRYLKLDGIFVLTVQNPDGDTAKCRFESEGDARQFLIVSGMDFDTAWDFCREAARAIRMSGKIDHRQWSSVTVTDQEMASVKAYLILRGNGGLFHTDRLDCLLEKLHQHPIPDDLFAIVRGQVAECDRQNTETWGHKDGHLAALVAGCATE